MYSPKELEEEVDHSFFDSDCEVDGKDTVTDKAEHSNINRSNSFQNAGKQPTLSGLDALTRLSSFEGGLKENGSKEVDAHEKRVENDATESRGDREEDSSQVDNLSEEIKEDLTVIEDQNVERKESCSRLEDKREREKVESGREDESMSSRGSTPLTGAERSEVRSGNQSDEGSSGHSGSSVEVHTASSSEDKELDDYGDAVFDDIDGEEDGYHRSEDEDESEEEERPPEPIPSKDSTLGTPKRSSRNHSRSLSSSSEPESSCSSSESYTSEPSPQRKPTVSQAISLPRRRPRLGFVMHRDRPKPSEMPESEDSVTDVTPLSTPDNSPVQSFDFTSGIRARAHTVTAAEQCGVDPRQPEDAAVTCEQKDEAVAQQLHPDIKDDVNVVAEAEEDQGESDSEDVLLRVGHRLSGELVIDCHGGRSRKNYSFTNDEVRRIDRENQRLLRELSRPSTRCRSAITSSCSSAASSSSRRLGAPPRLYHSALNRQREQQRIERENLAFLKRLESVRATPGMTRAEQLADYQKQAGYLGISTPLPLPLPTHHRSPSTSDRAPSSRASTGQSTRLGSSANGRHSGRPGTAKTNGASTRRPAWS